MDIFGAGPQPPVAIPADFNAEDAPNHEDIEKQFAVTCIEQAETYWKLINSIPPSKIKLTSHDDDIYDTFLKAFPEYAEDNKLKQITDEDMKSAAMKTRWRAYIKEWEKLIDDFNFGTLVRSNCEDDYTEENSVFMTRIQFYAIEIARNKRGLNDAVYQKAQAEKAKGK